MKLLNVTIVEGFGADDVFIRTDMIEAAYPYRDPLIIQFKAAHGTGRAYVQNNFPEIKDIEVIKRNGS